MNEFRLYWYDRGDQQCLRFVIRPRDLFQGTGLLADTETARFDRYLFARLLHRDTLLTRGGGAVLLDLIAQRRFQDRQIESAFYKEYRAFRDHLYTALLTSNGEGTDRFPGTRGRLVRLAQKILDRLLFVFFCEDMGQALAFPPKLLQGFLTTRSVGPYFDPDAITIWHMLLRLFQAMNAGTAFVGKAMHQFNGGLFAPDAALEALHVPNRLFCQPMQGQNDASIRAHPLTLLYFCATYNYAADLGEGGLHGERKRLGLYMLGRIFEQSITELEILEAEADGRPSVNKESKRKRDGVYYTPEWVVERVVTGTLGPCLADIRRNCGWPPEGEDLPELAAVDAYLGRLGTFTVLDPACGSGAFLITALRYLLAEWKRVRLMRHEVTGGPAHVEDEAAIVRDILRSNLYGVDINPASVEIAQLALWLHTARADQPLSSLDETIRIGNSLVTEDFYRGVQPSLYDDSARERVSAFDWRERFPEVAARGGFDAVVSNPPYVKLQNFRPAHPDIAAYLVRGSVVVAAPFESTRTGNFDLYLPFIEQGLKMLNSAGRLGYIAPSLWTTNEYGFGLRSYVGAGRHLDRWLDFKSFQVFEEATTYTALQFYSKAPTPAIRVAQASNGVVPPDPWADAGQWLAWDRVTFGDRWLLLTGEERALVDRLSATCRALGHSAHTTHIFQGLITSADAIYCLTRLGPGHYLCKPNGKPRPPPPFEVQIEDALMRPIVSGSETKRYADLATETYILFPYVMEKKGYRLITAPELAARYPRAWTHLTAFESVLRQRELRRDGSGNVLEQPFNDDEWYRFGRNQNLDKQHLPKLVVAQTVPSLRVSYDHEGRFALHNVRVNGILPGGGIDPWFLLGILNAPVADFVFRRIARPKDGDWFEANRQFIAPRPIPTADPDQQVAVAAGARELQRLHTQRRDHLAGIARRLDAAERRERPESWLLAGLRPWQERVAGTPGQDTPARRASAKASYQADLAARLGAITQRLHPTATLEATLHDGELAFLVDGVPVVDRVFVSEPEAAFLLAQWKVVAFTFAVTERTDGKALCNALRRLAPADNRAIAEQVVASVDQLAACEAAITAAEAAMDERVARLYALTPAEKALVAKG